MPRTKSAKKALRQSKRRGAENLKKKKELANILKLYKKTAAAEKVEETKKTLSLVYKKLDKAAKANLIKKNKASRLKSRLSKLIASR